MADAASRAPYRVSLVVFDVDGTLIDFVGALRTALRATAAGVSTLVGRDVDAESVQSAFRAVQADPEWRMRDPWESRVESLRRLLARIGGDPGAAGDLAQEYRLVRDRSITVYEDVLPALDALRDAGLPMRAATNGNMDLEPLGLASYFEVVHMAHELGVAKPDPRFYATVVARAGVAPSDALAVGDRVDNDYEPARAAGLHALLIDRAGRLEAGLPMVRALTELAALVEVIPRAVM